MPLANSLPDADSLSHPEARYPLDLAFCTHCSLVQITETVPPEKLFREYLYFSSYSDTMLEHARRLVEMLISSRNLGARHLVVELASNDGYLLQYYRKAGIPVLGIEPAENVARVAREERGIATLTEFFGRELADRLRAEGSQADVVHAHNVLAHVADLPGFVAGIRTLLAPDGVAVLEVPYVKDLVDRCAFDTIYHEHLCYFSLTALQSLFDRNGLEVRGVERITIHGGSLRLFVGHPGSPPAASEEVRSMLDDEAGRGMGRPEYYEAFSRRVEALKGELLAFLGALKAGGKRLAGYGAAAKGAVLLNYIGIGRDLLEFVVDRNDHKQGRYMPGVHLPIRPPEYLLEAMPDYVLLLAWNLADEIIAQQSEYRRRGGRFVVPVPEPRVLES